MRSLRLRYDTWGEPGGHRSLIEIALWSSTPAIGQDRFASELKELDQGEVVAKSWAMDDIPEAEEESTAHGRDPQPQSVRSRKLTKEEVAACASALLQLKPTVLGPSWESADACDGGGGHLAIHSVDFKVDLDWRDNGWTAWSGLDELLTFMDRLADTDPTS